MLAIVLATVSSVVYGFSDFAGGLSARRSAVPIASGISAAAGLALLLATMPILAGEWSHDAVLFGLLSGLGSTLLFVTLYAALAIGPIGILSPVIAVTGATVPVIFAVIQGDRVGALSWLGIALAVASIVVVSFAYDPAHHRPTALGLALAVTCGISVGTVFILLTRAPASSGSVPVLMNRCVTAGILVTFMLMWLMIKRLRHRTSISAPRGALMLAAGAGVMDTSANLLFTAAAHIGPFAIVAVLTSLYPGSTILCARFILKERLTRTQISGLLLAAVAVVLLALTR